MLLVEAFDEYLNYLKEKNASNFTIRNYRHYLSRFLNWLQLFFPTSPLVENISSTSIQNYIGYLNQIRDKKGNLLESKTKDYHLIALRSFLNFLKNKGLKVPDGSEIMLSSKNEPKIKLLSSKEVSFLLTKPIVSTKEGLRDKAILELLFSTGLKVSELVSLNRGDVDLRGGKILIKGKEGKKRLISLSSSCKKWLWRYLNSREDESSAFFIRYGGKKGDLRLNPRSVQRIVEKYAKKAKLPFRVTPYVLRHSFAAKLLLSGVKLQNIQKILGHKNIYTTKIYKWAIASKNELLSTKIA